MRRFVIAAAAVGLMLVLSGLNQNAQAGWGHSCGYYSYPSYHTSWYAPRSYYYQPYSYYYSPYSYYSAYRPYSYGYTYGYYPGAAYRYSYGYTYPSYAYGPGLSLWW